MADMTISQLLAEAGYTHTATADGGAHKITETATGRLVGFMHHNQAVEFLSNLPAAKAA